MIEFSGVTTSYSYEFFLRNISFELLNSEFAFICSERLCEANAILKLLVMPEIDREGTVELDGIDARKLSGKEKAAYLKKFAIASDRIGLVPNRTLYENLLMPALVTSQAQQAKDRISDVLSISGLRSKARKCPSELSALEERKAVIARAVISSPQAVLASNLMGSLEIVDSMEIIRLLFDINLYYGVCVLATVDTPSIIKSLDKRILYIENGSLRHKPERSARAMG
ncbi:MAG: ATP-binding cassette domain-containing protein [Eubacteriaceae bacterium]|nr:ATP-binding cassette domain-containing protein [Eubacteriaceae bacterium]